DQNIERRSLSCAVRPQQSNHLALLNLQADVIYNFPASVRLAQVGSLEFQHARSFLNSVLGQRARTLLRINQNRIIRHKEGQRMARSCVAGGIRNRRLTARKHEFPVGRQVFPLLRHPPPVPLAHYHVARGPPPGCLPSPPPPSRERRGRLEPEPPGLPRLAQ